MTNKYVLTFDIDWAPDFAILDCLDILDKAKISATFFTTHSTVMNEEIIRRGHILGIHPNFLNNSSHGNNTYSIIKNCLSYAPNAWCIRTHALVQSSPLLFEIFNNFPQLKLDVSLFMHRSIYSHKCSWDFNGVIFERLLYNWEDDAEFSNQRFCNPNELFFGDLTVLDFHPIHVFLNSSNGTEYKKLKDKIAGTALQKINNKTAEKFKNDGIGVRNHLDSILASNYTCVSLKSI